MSGGHFDYQDAHLCARIFGEWECSPEYGIGEEEQRKTARKARNKGPFEDRCVNELVYDVFCLIHSYDWYISGDCCQDTYLKDVDAFKNKWLKPFGKKRTQTMIDTSLEEERERLYRDLGVREE